MPLSWFVLHSHPNKEELLAQQVEVRGFEVFFPFLPAHPVNPRARKIKPYFPGYIFARVNLDESGMSVFEWMPYTTGLVKFGGDPAVVPDALVKAIQKRVFEVTSNIGEKRGSFEQGDEVLIREGIFEGYEAIFDANLSGNERVRVLLKMLNHRAVPIDLPGAQISQKKNRKRVV
jgi:transcription antitermination factor NusG